MIGILGVGVHTRTHTAKRKIDSQTADTAWQKPRWVLSLLTRYDKKGQNRNTLEENETENKPDVQWREWSDRKTWNIMVFGQFHIELSSTFYLYESLFLLGIFKFIIFHAGRISNIQKRTTILKKKGFLSSGFFLWYSGETSLLLKQVCWSLLCMWE